MSRRSWILVFLLAIIVGSFEATFVTLLPSPWREFHPVLNVAVILVIVNRARPALLYSAVAGLVLDTFSQDMGAFALARVLVITFTLWILSESVITNRSVYASIALVIVARLIDKIWILIAHLLGNGLFRWDIQQEPIGSALLTFGWDVAIVGLSFILIASFTRRFLMPVSRANYEF